MRIALSANLQVGRWDEALKAVRLLEKTQRSAPGLGAQAEVHAIYRELMIAQSHDPAALEAMWRLVPEAERRVAGDRTRRRSIVQRVWLRLGSTCDRSRSKARCRILPATGITRPAACSTNMRARRRFAARNQLERVEIVAAGCAGGGNPGRHCSVQPGLICLRQQLWGKSKGYLLESLAAESHPATLLALARLADAIDDGAESAAYFKRAALGFATLSNFASESTPLWRGQRDLGS